ncbi:restriction endonuclease subunit S [Massilia sp. DJPM01]|uniref:restriction endonuclease subunit S n=1 Tax=Massilia sp. DJPM01 TaxID=3024404 RepID=UPI00259FB8EE|nr:restriction endonuclease subunit S [Massilia sp. DJPM01]MDM5177056.1 restriction endonuclease subunit S [Massilia sp. DJPM01]
MIANWTTAPIAKLTEKVGSGATPRGGEAAYTLSGTPLIRSMNVVFFGFKRDGLAFIDDYQASALDGATVRANDILLNITGASIGRVTLAPHDMDGARVNQHVCIIRPNTCIDSRYFRAYLSSPALQSKIWADNTGTTRQALTKQQILAFEVPIPPLAEQRRIADKLDTMLARIAAMNCRLARVGPLLKRFRQSVLAAATSGKLTERWRTQMNAPSWSITTVDTVAAVGTGSTPLRSNTDFFAAIGVPWITSAATGQSLVTTATENVTDLAIAVHRLKRYPVGTLLVAMYGEGKTRGQVSELGIEATINQACAAIVVDESRMLRSFVKLALRANYLQMRDLAEGGNQPNLNLSKIKAFPLPAPSMDEQAEIVRRVEFLFTYVDRLEARLQAAQSATERLTPSLLAKAFRGELVPQDPTDESSNELLRRQAAAAPETAKRGKKVTA